MGARNRVLANRKKSNLLVTIDDYKLKGFIVTDTVVGVEWNNYDGVIFHSSKDDDLTVYSEIVKAKDKLKYVIYINSDIKPIFFSLFSGINADIYNNSDLLSDDAVVEFMVTQYGKTGLTIRSSAQDFESLNKSLKKVLSAEETDVRNFVKNRLWKKSVCEALATVDSSLARADQINSDMVQIIGQAKVQADKLMETNQEISEQLSSLQETMTDFTNGVSTTPMIYSAYKVSAATKRVLSIKCYSHCNYLMSFLIAYQKYLKQIRGVDSRILLVLPNLPIYTTRYRELPRLAIETLGVMQNLNKELYCTFEPKREVMKRFFEGNNLLYIVVDEMYSNAIISSGAKVEKFCAVSGTSDLDRFDLDVSRTFFPVAGVNKGFVIPYIKDYAEKYTNTPSKLQAYFTGCKSLYERLDDILGIGKE